MNLERLLVLERQDSWSKEEAEEYRQEKESYLAKGASEALKFIYSKDISKLIIAIHCHVGYLAQILTMNRLSYEINCRSNHMHDVNDYCYIRIAHDNNSLRLLGLDNVIASLASISKDPHIKYEDKGYEITCLGKIGKEWDLDDDLWSY